MAHFARMSETDANGVRTALEILELDSIQGRFHPDVAKHIIAAPNAAVVGSTKEGSSWTHPVPPEPAEPEPAPRRLVLTPPEYLLQFTSAERVEIRARADGEGQEAPVLRDWLTILADPRLTAVDLSLASTKEGHAFLVSLGTLTEERRAEIEAGLPA